MSSKLGVVALSVSAVLSLSTREAAAQGIEIYKDGEIVINNVSGNSGYIAINTGNLSISHATDPTYQGGTFRIAGNDPDTSDADAQLKVASNVTINPSGTMTSAGAIGTLTVGGNWTRDTAGTWTPGNSIVLFNGSTANQTVSIAGATAAESFYDLIVNCPSYTLTTGSDGDTLNVTNIFRLSGGTFDADPAAAQIQHTFASYTQQGTSVLKIDIGGSTGNTTANISVTGDFTVTGGTFGGDTSITTQEINVGGNVSVTATSWLFHGWFRLRGPADNVGADTRTIHLASGSKIRVLDVWLQDNEDIYDVSTLVTTEYVSITTAELRAGAGATLTVQNQTEAGFTTTDSATGNLGRIRFDGNNAHANRRFTVSGGTVNAYRIGADGTGDNDGLFTLSSGTITLTLTPNGNGGDVAFDNLDDTGNESPEIQISGGTLNVAGAWEIADSEPSASLTFTMSGGSLVINGAAPQTLTHSPEAGSLTLNNVTINNTGTTLTAAVSAGDATINVASTSGWPSSGSIFIEEDEITYTGKTATTFTGCSGALAHANGLTVRGPVTIASSMTIANTLTFTAAWLKISGSTASATLTLSAVHAVTVPAGNAIDLEPQGANNAGWVWPAGSSFTINGTFEALRAPGATGTSTISASGADSTGWTMTVGATGTFDAEYFTFSDLGDAGVVVSNGGTIKRIHQSTFTKETSRTGPCLDLSAVAGANRAKVPYTANGVTFNGSSGDNVKSGVDTPLIWFLGSTSDNGARWGESFDDDKGENDVSMPNNGRVLWETGLIRNMTTSTNYNTLKAAIDAATAGDRIRPQKTIVFDGNHDITVDVILENFVFYPRASNSPAVDGGSALRGSLHNCVIAAGGADYVRLRNCTVWAPVGTPTTTNCVAYNTIFEEAAPGLSTDVNNLKGAASGLFRNANALDFHLVADDNGGTSGPPTGWSTTPSEDIETNSRPAAAPWDRGADEYNNIGAQALAVDTGSVNRFHWIGVQRGSSTSTYGFAYLISGGGSTTSGNSNTLYVVNLDGSMSVVSQIQAAGPILHMMYMVDNRNTGASWRAWIFCVVDTNSDGFGDAIQLIVDRGDSGLMKPSQAVSDPDAYDRQFGDATAPNGDKIYQPWSTVTNYRIKWITLATVTSDGSDDDASVVFNSPSGANRCKWLRLFFVAEKTTATTGGSLFKVNADPYDTNDNAGANNRQFGRTIWAVLPSVDADIPNDTATNWVDFDYRAPLTFTWATGFLKIFPSVTTESSSDQTVLSRWSMSGTDPTLVYDSKWKGIEEASVQVDNRYGVTLDNGSSGAYCTYAASNSNRVYNRNVDSSGTDRYEYWASLLRNAGDTANVTPVLQPQRFWPQSFALIAFDTGVHKIWSQGGPICYFESYAAGTMTVSGPASPATNDFPSSGTIYVGGTAVTYTGKTGTTFTGCSGVGTHPVGAPVMTSANNKSGCLASTGRKLELGSSTAGDEVSVSGAQDTDWPLTSVGQPLVKIWVRGNKLYWGTDKGYVHGYTWNWDGSSVASGDETQVAGFPYVIVGSRITWIFSHPVNGGILMIGTDNGGFYRFNAPN